MYIRKRCKGKKVWHHIFNKICMIMLSFFLIHDTKWNITLRVSKQLTCEKILSETRITYIHSIKFNKIEFVILKKWSLLTCYRYSTFILPFIMSTYYISDIFSTRQKWTLPWWQQSYVVIITAHQKYRIAWRFLRVLILVHLQILLIIWPHAL